MSSTRRNSPKNSPWIARQGDVLLVAVPSIPAEARAHPRPNDRGRVVLAYGEVTGHAHALAEGTALAFGPSDDAFWLEVPEGAEAVVTHEEHAAIAIPADVRFVAVRRQVEYTPERLVNVAD